MAETAQTGSKSGTLTRKEIIFLKGVASGKTNVAAAQEAYPTANYQTAAAIASENLRKPKIQEALTAAYEATGINAQSIADVLRDAMLAKKSVQVDGTLLETNVADHSVRVNAARTAAHLVGAGNKGDDGSEKPTINFNIGTKNYIKAS